MKAEGFVVNLLLIYFAAVENLRERKLSNLSRENHGEGKAFNDVLNFNFFSFLKTFSKDWENLFNLTPFKRRNLKFFPAQFHFPSAIVITARCLPHDRCYHLLQGMNNEYAYVASNVENRKRKRQGKAI